MKRTVSPDAVYPDGSRVQAVTHQYPSGRRAYFERINFDDGQIIIHSIRWDPNNDAYPEPTPHFWSNR